MLDANAYDPLVDTPGVADMVRAACDAGSIELLQTHIQNEELMRDERRHDGTLALPAVFVPTYGFVLGSSRLGLARVGEGEKIDAIRSPTKGHTHDAILATTADYEGATLVTDDRRLTNFAKREGIVVWNSSTFIDFIRTLVP